MAVPSRLVSSHVLFAFAAVAGIWALTRPSDVVVVLSVLVGLVAFALRVGVALVDPTLRGRDLAGPAAAIGLLLLPSVVAMVGSPLSVRAPEGAGPIVEGFAGLAGLAVPLLVLAVALLPAAAARSVWSIQDTPRRTILGAAAALWAVSFLTLASGWFRGGLWPGAAMDAFAVVARSALALLAFGFVYALKADPRIGSDHRRCADVR